jgi:hypothetical protein
MSTHGYDLDNSATTRGFSAGQTILKRFRLDRILGRGGMGVVWAAYDTELEEPVALKFLPEPVVGDEAAIDDLKREVRRARQLSHPHIVRIHGFETDGRVAAVSMELIEGQTLTARRLGSSAKVFSVSEIADWTLQLTQALNYAHGQARVVHRDLKPANLMITASQRLKILDFGIAASISESTSRMTNKGTSGTLTYMSPQQLSGKIPTPADDLYALGATLYELLSGKPPFFRGEITMQILHAAPESIEARRAELGYTASEAIPAVWNDVICSLLAKDPAQRPSSALEVAQRLGLAVSTLEFPTNATVSIPEAPANPPRTVPAPPPVPAVQVHAKIKSPMPRHLLAGSLVAGACIVLGGAYWGLDVGDRLRARSAIQRAEQMQSTDSVGAIGLAKEAVRLRPEDPGYRRYHELLQRDWLAALDARLAPLTPEQRYSLMRTLPPDLDSVFDSAYRDRFKVLSEKITEQLRTAVRAKLADAERSVASKGYEQALRSLDALRAYALAVPEISTLADRLRRSQQGDSLVSAKGLAAKENFAAALQELDVAEARGLMLDEIAAARREVRQAQVRAEIAQALGVSEKGDHKAALLYLTKTAQLGLLEEEVSLARARVLAAAESAMIAKLGSAIAAGQLPEVRARLDEFSQLANRTFDVRPEALVAEKKLERFLAMLQELRIRPASVEQRSHALDLALVAKLRKRFENESAVTDFLGRSYSEWAARELSRQNLGGALYLDDRSRAENGKGDALLRRNALAAAARELAFAVAVPPVDSTLDTPASLANAPREILRSAIGEKTGDWIKLVDASTAQTPAAFVLKSKARGPATTHTRSARTEYAQYQSGTRTEDNPEYYRLSERLVDAESHLRDIQASNAIATQQANSYAGASKTGMWGALIVNTAAVVSTTGAQNAVNDLRRELAGTPRTIKEPVYDQEPYTVTTHSLTHKADFAYQLERDGKALGNFQPYAAEFSLEAEEVTGNARRNVPVKPVNLPSASEVNRRLTESLSAQARADAPALRAQLSAGSFDLLRERLKEAKSTMSVRADRFWALGELWAAAGVAVSERGRHEAELRATLGIPAAF